MDLINDPAFWFALGQIIWINIILSGDNAVVIALAAKDLPPHQQKKAVAIGAGGAVVLRIILTFVAGYLLKFPYLQIVGGLLLIWIGVQLLAESTDDDEEGGVKAHGNLMTAVRTILIADLVMSLDNVIGVALAAKINGEVNFTLLVIGLIISIPMVIFGSTLMIKLMERFPQIVVIGSGLIGWVAGDAFVHDPVVKGFFEGNTLLSYGVKVASALFVVGLGLWLKKRAHTANAVSAKAGA